MWTYKQAELQGGEIGFWQCRNRPLGIHYSRELAFCCREGKRQRLIDFVSSVTQDRNSGMSSQDLRRALCDMGFHESQINFALSRGCKDAVQAVSLLTDEANDVNSGRAHAMSTGSNAANHQAASRDDADHSSSSQSSRSSKDHKPSAQNSSRTENSRSREIMQNPEEKRKGIRGMFEQLGGSFFKESSRGSSGYSQGRHGHGQRVNGSSEQNRNSTSHVTSSDYSPARNGAQVYRDCDEDEDEDYRRAIEESKREANLDSHSGMRDDSAGNESEEKQIKEAIQRSLQETPYEDLSWTVADVKDDARERKRIPADAPVGLRNIGNTCYLNSLLQVYFNLTDFRRAILRYNPPQAYFDAIGAPEQGKTDVMEQQEAAKESLKGPAEMSRTAAPEDMFWESPSSSNEKAFSLMPHPVPSQEDVQAASDQSPIRNVQYHSSAEKPSSSHDGLQPSSSTPHQSTSTGAQLTLSLANCDKNQSHEKKLPQYPPQGEHRQLAERDTAMDNNAECCIGPLEAQHLDRDTRAVSSIEKQPDITLWSAELQQNRMRSDADRTSMPGESRNSYSVENENAGNSPRRLKNTDLDGKRDDGIDRSLLSAVEFVLELQRLFARMAFGNQKYADPSALVAKMRDANDRPIDIGGQQDASEFNGLFLDIVERAFRREKPHVARHGASAECNHSSPGCVDALTRLPSWRTNAVKQLFTAAFRQYVTFENDKEGTHSGAAPPIEQNTIALLVDATVEKNRELYSGLDDYVCTKIDYSMQQDSTMSPPTALHGLQHQNSSQPATKSVWFTHFPPVLTIYLQRVVYNRVTCQAEKIHKRYNFETEISVDRYLEINRPDAERARSVVREARSRQNQAANFLGKLYHFPISQEIEQAITMNGRASDKRVHPSTSVNSPPLPTAARTAAGGPLFASAAAHMTNLSASAEHRDNICTAIERVQQRLYAAVTDKGEQSCFAVPGLSAPHVENAVRLLSDVKNRDRIMMETLMRDIQKWQREEEFAYKNLDGEKYELHAVLVHDGAPSSGHYWTFIRDPRSRDAAKSWLKFNDTNVTDISQHDMLAAAVGGMDCASAYCLIYTRKMSHSKVCSIERKHEYSDNDENDGGVNIVERDLLPHSRLAELEKENAEFLREVLIAEESQKKEAKARQARTVIDEAVSILRQNRESLNECASSVRKVHTVPGAHDVVRRDSCRVRSLVEFCLSQNDAFSALVHALDESWSSHMKNTPNYRSFVKYLQIDRGSENQDATRPWESSQKIEKERDQSAVILEQIAELLPMVHAQASDFSQLIPIDIVKRVSEALRHENSSFVTAAFPQQAKVYYHCALLATAVMTRAMELTEQGEWDTALCLWCWIVGQDEGVYSTLSDADPPCSVVASFVLDRDFVFYRRELEAIKILPTILTAAYIAAFDTSSIPSGDFKISRTAVLTSLQIVSNRIRQKDNINATHAAMMGGSMIHPEGVLLAVAESYLSESARKRRAEYQSDAEVDSFLRKARERVLQNTASLSFESLPSRFEVIRDRFLRLCGDASEETRTVTAAKDLIQLICQRTTVS